MNSKIPMDVEKNTVSTGDSSTDINYKHPQDGWYAWLIVLVGCVLCMLSDGTIRAHGIYQEHYELHEFPNESITAISWIGSIQNTLLTICGIIAAVLSDRFDTRILIAIASFCMGAAFIAASFSTKIWQLILTQGVIFGFFASFLYVLGASIPLQWISKRRGLAVAIIYAGTGIGGIWISVLVQKCIDTVGRPWSNRILGIITIFLGTGLSPLLITRRQNVTEDKNCSKIKDLLMAFTGPKFILVAVASSLAMGPNIIPYLLMPSYAIKVLKKPAKVGSLLITLINATTIIGRFVGGILADYFGALNILIIWTALAALSLLALWLPFFNLSTLVAAAVLFGTTGSVVGGLVLTMASDFYHSDMIIYAAGIIHMIYAISSIFIIQTASLMLDTEGKDINYLWPITYVGGILVIATLSLILLRCILFPRLLFKI